MKLDHKNPKSIRHIFCDTSGEDMNKHPLTEGRELTTEQIMKSQKSNLVRQWIYWDYLQEHGRLTAAASPKAYSSMGDEAWKL